MSGLFMLALMLQQNTKSQVRNTWLQHWSTFQNKALCLCRHASLFLAHHHAHNSYCLLIQKKQYLCVSFLWSPCFVLCLCWSITSALKNRVSRERWAAAVWAMYPHPTFWHHLCSSAPSYKSLLMTLRRTQRKITRQRKEKGISPAFSRTGEKL